MPSYEKTAYELVHSEVREAIINGHLESEIQRTSFELSKKLSYRYKKSYANNAALKIFRCRCKKFFRDYYRPLLLDSRLYFKVLDINGEKNVGVFAASTIHCNDYAFIDSLKGFRGQHISELKAVTSHLVFQVKNIIIIHYL